MQKKGRLVKDLMDPTDYFQFSLMVSNISPFPSGTSKILLATPNKDGFYPSIAELAESQSEAYEIFSDKIVETLENYMYFPEPEFSKNKTENILKEIMSKLKYSH